MKRFSQNPRVMVAIVASPLAADWRCFGLISFQSHGVEKKDAKE